MIAANYFDGRTARAHAVELAAADGLLTLRGAVERTYAAAATRIAEPFEQAPTVLYFEDGARCEVAGAEPGRLLRDALGYRATRVVRLTRHTWAALVALVLLLALVGSAYVWGVPAAAMRIAATLPPAVDRSLGENGLKALEASGKLRESRLSDEWQAEVHQALRRVAPPGMRLRLLVRNSYVLGANAIALPDGTIVMTDQMVRLIAGKSGGFGQNKPAQLDGENERAQLAGVLAHEIGHVRMRHGTRILAGSSLSAALAGTLFGDLSGVASLPAAVARLNYSREMEAEADDYAIALLHDKGISTLPLASLLDRMAQRDGQAAKKESRWLRASFLSTHPQPEERAARLRAAAQP